MTGVQTCALPISFDFPPKIVYSCRRNALYVGYIYSRYIYASISCLRTPFFTYVSVLALKMITKNNTLDILDALIDKDGTILLFTYTFCIVIHPIVWLDQKRWILFTSVDTQCVLQHTGHDDTMTT